jgi:hypothetical protein
MRADEYIGGKRGERVSTVEGPQATERAFKSLFEK